MAAGGNGIAVCGNLAAGCTLAAALAACAWNTPPKVEENVYPADYRHDIVVNMSNVVEDPSNIRDAFVSEPALMPVGGSQRYVACVRFNPKQSATAYAGNQERVAIFYNGRLIHFIAPTGEQCEHAAYKPFPELEKICLKEHC